MILGGSRSKVSQQFSAATNRSIGRILGGTRNNEVAPAPAQLKWCFPRCLVRRNKECCFNPSCYAKRRQTCRWMQYLGGSGSGSSSSSSYGDNEMIKTCEVIDLDTRKIITIILMFISQFLIRPLDTKDVEQKSSIHKSVVDETKTRTRPSKTTRVKCNKIKILIRPLDTANCTNMTAMMIFAQAEI